MATLTTALVQTAALSLTRTQIQQAMTLAQESGFNSPADSTFIGAILVSLAVNTSSLTQLLDRIPDDLQ